MTEQQQNTLDGFFAQAVPSSLKTMIQSGLHYFSFAIMGSVIELLGAVYDSDDFHKVGVSKSRFNTTLERIPNLKRYERYKDTTHDLYANMRCGMAHVGKPGPGVVFTQRTDATCGRRHLENDAFNGTSRLILVCEDLYDDIIKAIDYVRTDTTTTSRLNERFMDPALQPDPPRVSAENPSASG